MLNKESIRAHRESLRSNFKTILQTTPCGSRRVPLSDRIVENIESPEKTRKNQKSRKSSLDSQDLNCMTKLNDVYTYDAFDQIFIRMEKIGEGAQSVVYKCQEKNTGKVFAVKHIRIKE